MATVFISQAVARWPHTADPVGNGVQGNNPTCVHKKSSDDLKNLKVTSEVMMLAHKV